MSNKGKRKALGSGLSNLIPAAPENEGNTGDISYIDVELIEPNPYQPRKSFSEDDIKELSESIESQGLLQPLVLRRHGRKYNIISGERRFRALKLIKRQKIPCIVKEDVDDTAMLEMALVENIQRENLNEIETAQTYKELLERCKLSHDELSKRVGKSRSAITNTLRFLNLPEKIKRLVIEDKISGGHARTLMGMDSEEEMLKVAERISTENLSVRATEEEVKKGRKGKKSKKGSKKDTSKQEQDKDPDLMEVEDKLKYKYGTKVSINHTDSYKGSIKLDFYSRDDINRLITLLLER